LAFALLAGAGCHTPTKRQVDISPPGTKAAKFVLPHRNLKPFDPSTLPKYRFLTWDDCGPQPEGTVYRVYDTDDFSYWALYAETPLKFVPINITNSPCRFFSVSAYWNGIEVFGTTQVCP
jgi:hypothetical protein